MKKLFYFGIEGASFLLPFVMTFYSCFFWSKIPEKIPTHFNLLGQIDHYGDKKMLALLLVIVWLIYGLLSLMQKYPKMYAWSKEIGENERNHQFQQMAKESIAMQKGLFMGLFSYIFFHTIQQTSLNMIMLLAFILAISGILLWEGRKILSNNKE